MEAGGTIRAVAENGQWLPGEQHPGVNNNVWALTWGPDGALYVGGQFGWAGGVSGTTNIARWTPDGTDGSWSALGSGVNNTVRALAWGPDGALYAGGDFTSAGGVSAHAIAKWDGSTWSSIGNLAPFGLGETASAHALIVFDDGSGEHLYVGGNFVHAGGAAVNRLGRWDGTSWTDMFGHNFGPIGGVNDTVHALASFDDGTGGGRALAVGGEFTSTTPAGTPNGESLDVNHIALIGIVVILIAGCATPPERQATTYLYAMDGERIELPWRCDIHMAPWIGARELWIACDAESDNAVAATLRMRSGNCTAIPEYGPLVGSSVQYGYTMSDFKRWLDGAEAHVRLMQAANYCVVLSAPSVEAIEILSRAVRARERAPNNAMERPRAGGF
jgi:hypothetical protein